MKDKKNKKVNKFKLEELLEIRKLLQTKEGINSFYYNQVDRQIKELQKKK